MFKRYRNYKKLEKRINELEEDLSLTREYLAMELKLKQQTRDAMKTREMLNQCRINILKGYENDKIKELEALDQVDLKKDQEGGIYG